MAEGANLSSIEAVAEFRRALQQFQEDANNALTTVDQQTRRALQWFDHDGPVMWRAAIRKQYDAVAAARNAWENCRMRIVAGREPDCYEEKQKYRAAQRRLEEAEEKLKLLQRWSVRLHREVDEYKARVSALHHQLDGQVPKTLALLARMHGALLQYSSDSPTGIADGIAGHPSPGPTERIRPPFAQPGSPAPGNPDSGNPDSGIGEEPNPRAPDIPTESAEVKPAEQVRPAERVKPAEQEPSP